MKFSCFLHPVHWPPSTSKKQFEVLCSFSDGFRECHIPLPSPLPGSRTNALHFCCGSTFWQLDMWDPSRSLDWTQIQSTIPFRQKTSTWTTAESLQVVFKSPLVRCPFLFISECPSPFSPLYTLSFVDPLYMSFCLSSWRRFCALSPLPLSSVFICDSLSCQYPQSWTAHVQPCIIRPRMIVMISGIYAVVLTYSITCPFLNTISLSFSFFLTKW